MKFLILLIFSLNTLVYSQNIQNSISQYNSGNYKSAINGFKKLIEKEPNNFKAYYYLGMCYMMIEDGEKAIENLSLSIQKNNRFADAYNSRGLAYGYIGEVQNSLDDFDRALIIDPNFAEAYLNRATAHNNIGNIQQAIEDFTSSIRLNPNNPSVFYQRGQLYLQQKNYNEAIKDIQHSIDVGFKNSEVLFELGNCYFYSEQWRKAIDAYSESIRLNPNNDKSINNRALSYEKIGKKEEAEKDRKRLEKMAGVKFTPFEKIKWKTFKSSDNSISIELPSDWFFYEVEKSVDRTEILITPVKWDKKSATIMTSANLVMNRNMQALYGVSDPSLLLDFWSDSNAKNTEEYYKYTVGSQQIKLLDGYQAKIFRTYRQIDDRSIPYESFEVSAANDNVLFYGYLQSPEKQWPYYQKIFEKAIKTLKFQ